MAGIGSLSGAALECRDPAALARFYSALIGWPVTYSSPEWVSLGGSDGLDLSFQLSPDYRPPTWPDPHSSMQFHLHVRVPELDSAVAAVQALGGRILAEEEGFRVMADPAGHVFCLVPLALADPGDARRSAGEP